MMTFIIMEKKKCLYSRSKKCRELRWNETPFCQRHYENLIEIIQDDGDNIIQNAGALNSFANITQGLAQASKFAQTGFAKAEQASNLINQGINRAEELTNKAQALAERTSGITNQLGDLYSNFIPERDLNYSESSLSNSAPLSPNSGQNFQTFGDYICLKKEFVKDLRILFNELFTKRNVEI